MAKHRVVSSEEWLAARRQLLVKEKEFTRLRDQLSQLRRDLPWERVDKSYLFEGPEGKISFAGLFAGRSQLIVQHFMFDPGWSEGCKSCSFWADNFDGFYRHLNERDVTLVAVSRAPWVTIAPFKTRMGWSFPWVSSAGSDFNFDCRVSFTPEELAAGEVDYNFARRKTSMTELPGVSVFYKDPSGKIFRTYSCYARGLDMLNAAYHYLDLVPKGRDEAGLPYAQSWVRHHDKYGAADDDPRQRERS
ncbi:MAG TPA: thioredoxin family protein [Stellaceae bacterium]|jgi:predicted dithiol-disulfide oxidoreductase (DUF899 family)|nr:thioredoxin family protein [Stellaceae bacterium]